MRDEVTKILVGIIAVSFIWLLTGCDRVQLPNNRVAATVERIISGQTLEVSIEGNNQPQRVRIVGIKVAPSESWQKAAKKGLQNLIQNGQVYLELESLNSDLTNRDLPLDEAYRDRYGRILAHVWHNKALVSEELAKQGYVLANTKYPNQYSDRIFYAQEYARILGYGIWSSVLRLEKTESAMTASIESITK